MKAIILAAGYATRLWPLTKDKPKPLLEVAGKPIIEHILDRLEEMDNIGEIFIVTNAHFFQVFLEWQASLSFSIPLTIVNDKTTSNEGRLGSLGDILYVVENLNIGEDMIIVAGDNLFEFSLSELAEHYHSKKTPVIALYDVGDKEVAKNYGIVALDKFGKIIEFQEKPKDPKSDYSVTGIYLYDNQVFEAIKTCKPSDRGEMEITDVNNYYIKKGLLSWEELSGYWQDAGKFETLFAANAYWSKKQE